MINRLISIIRLLAWSFLLWYIWHEVGDQLWPEIQTVIHMFSLDF